MDLPFFQCSVTLLPQTSVVIHNPCRIARFHLISPYRLWSYVITSYLICTELHLSSTALRNPHPLTSYTLPSGILWFFVVALNIPSFSNSIDLLDIRDHYRFHLRVLVPQRLDTLVASFRGGHSLAGKSCVHSPAHEGRPSSSTPTPHLVLPSQTHYCLPLTCCMRLLLLRLVYLS
jgi:hypothetical protein